MSKLSPSDWITLVGIILPCIAVMVRFGVKIVRVWERIATAAETLLPRLDRIDARMMAMDTKIDEFLKGRSHANRNATGKSD